jgi:site-specific recombinase XerD
MHKYNTISSKKLLSRKVYQFYGCLQTSIKEYLSFKSKTLSEARIKSIKLYLERFSLYISNIHEIKIINNLDIKHINAFIKSCSIYTHDTCYATVNCIRQYLIYLEKNNLLNHTLSVSIPKIAKRRNRTFAHAFTKQETQALLQSIACNNSKERRDYAMLLLAARLGLRSSDIVNLKFKNINWEKSEISIIQQKTKKALILPLLNDVGEAIINYVKNGRPNVQDSHIFIRENKPYTCMSSGSLFTIVDEYLKRANIKVPANHRHGPHALRHSLATLLLEDNIPISTIKEILAHKSVETTKIYLKIAEKQLLKCALDVPTIATNRVS